MGGGTSGSRLRTTERYDPRAGKWESLRTDLIEVRSAGQATNCLDRLYVLGGTDQNQSVHSSLEVYNPEGGGSWIFRKSMQAPRMDFGCWVLSTEMFFLRPNSTGLNWMIGNWAQQCFRHVTV